MTYGIKIENSSGKLQIGSEDILEMLAIVDTGTAIPSVSGGSSHTVSVDPAKEFLAFNRTTAGFIRGSHNAAGTSWTVENNAASNYGPINWLKIQRGTSNTIATNSGYGINLHNSSGTVTFSTKWMEKSPDIQHIQDANTVGSQQGSNTNPFNNLTASMPADVIYTSGSLSNLANIYVTPGRMQFAVYSDSTSQQGGIRNGTFKYNSDGTIGAEGLISYSFDLFGNPANRVRYRIRQKNPSSIAVLLRRQ